MRDPQAALEGALRAVAVDELLAHPGGEVAAPRASSRRRRLDRLGGQQRARGALRYSAAVIMPCSSILREHQVAPRRRRPGCAIGS